MIYDVRRVYVNKVDEVSRSVKMGEIVKGKIVKKFNENEVLVKTGDGREIFAELEEGVDLEEGEFCTLKNSGFSEGKFKFKLIKNGENSIVKKEIINESSLKNVAKSLGGSFDDVSVLKEMIKRDVQLTKENFLKFKSVTTFNNIVKLDGAEVDVFIERYIQAKGENADGKEILKDFFKSFKSLERDEIMFFLENDIEISKENIESFKNVFKENDGVSKLFKEIKEITKDAKVSSKGIEEILGEKIVDIKLQSNEKERLPSLTAKRFEFEGNLLDNVYKDETKISNSTLVNTNTLNEKLINLIKDIYSNPKNLLKDTEFREIIKTFNGIKLESFIKILDSNTEFD